ncbi:MAG: hypothetical protein IT566_10100, partial [Rhodospirillaceae bacterium]|nr:hypothetical protein [Rhodospirillaceae bacterium]
EERKTLEQFSPFELNTEEYCRRMPTLALLDILDELRAIRAAAVSPPHIRGYLSHREQAQPQPRGPAPGRTEETVMDLLLVIALAYLFIGLGTGVEAFDGTDSLLLALLFGIIWPVVALIRLGQRLAAPPWESR